MLSTQGRELFFSFFFFDNTAIAFLFYINTHLHAYAYTYMKKLRSAQKSNYEDAE